MGDLTSPNGISRRSVIAGMAWSVPVIAGVSATPAFAASAEKATLLRNYDQASAVYGPWVAPGGSLFGGATGAIGLYVEQAASGAPAITVTTITLTLTVKASAFGTGTPVVTQSSTGTWTAGAVSVVGDEVKYSFTWVGTLNTKSGPRYTAVGFKLPPSSDPPFLQEMTTDEKTIEWSAISPQTTAVSDSIELITRSGSG